MAAPWVWDLANPTKATGIFPNRLEGVPPYPLGRRGKPVKKVRFMPMAKAHELARKLQGRLNTTISVI